jgi:hypothetical protein
VTERLLLDEQSTKYGQHTTISSLLPSQAASGCSPGGKMMNEHVGMTSQLSERDLGALNMDLAQHPGLCGTESTSRVNNPRHFR